MNLESNLMPFLQKEVKPNFKMDHNFPWIQDAIKKLDTMILENVGGPNELFEKYKKYEYLLNVEKSKLINELFKGGEDGKQKKPLGEIKKEV